MKKLSYLLFPISIVLYSCEKKEEALLPSNIDKNFLYVSDNPADPTAHAIYEVYKSTGVPIFYKDTIGSETRISATSGKSYTYYEVLSLKYSLNGGLSTLDYHYLADKTDILPATVFLRDQVLNSIPKNNYLPSILLLKDLSYNYVNTYTFIVNLSAYRGYNTLGIVAKDIATKSAADLKVLRSKILGTIAYKALASPKAAELETSFFQYSSNIGGITPVYYVSFTNLVKAKPTLTTLKAFGFLDYHPGFRNGTIGTGLTPSKEEVLMQYLSAIFLSSTAEFNLANSGNLTVIAKFAAAKKLLKDVGYTFTD
jgi:hypothetical protein